ncbi:MAG: nucleoside triphosphate pyrophosphohydrolase [Microbacterium sp.]|jgi:XTP/dITP diphosphohydrolase|uniref:Nucleoside triphosphate pyrophosphohydrolase n=1 Tax=Microbacterium ginsengisoli TaxID=400772 RepID=A0A0F0LRK5_9MICO|nr:MULTISPECIES: MazG family protein [Microbacterium]MAL07542.1 nucleoside triphosphate pyrophosphohydrolase [Microbacterium sp.]KJL34895.1 Nucleoside triphosphate pyrophosphohydrolase [Microbacterium ginsengisoli]KJL35020.1 Nucleoside triphosphate pyrophosphohydrolase [Microbacterium ginsengisoli]KQR90607.1 nucleoside triphosphate hydrolase [Microbacterium sp. Leaf351]KQR96794.1 nucleoside triphosphate hydrolase [Microbacterium sp. Leaf347]
MTDDGMTRAIEAMRAVRDECVWTQQIDHRDLVPYLVEESSELVDAVESGTRADLREELGDVLWQVLFHAEIASRDPDDPFDVQDVASDLADKMIRRHPHVFGGESARTPEEVLVLWTAAKAAEKRERTSVLDGIPAGLPALARAQKVLGKAAQVGLVPAMTDAAAPTDEAQLGDALLALVVAARAAGIDAERALRERVRGVESAVRAAEAAARGGDLEQ